MGLGLGISTVMPTSNAAAMNTRDHLRKHVEAVVRARLQRRRRRCRVYHPQPAGRTRRVREGSLLMPKLILMRALTHRPPSRRLISRVRLLRWRDTSGSCRDWRAMLATPLPRTRALLQASEAVDEHDFPFLDGSKEAVCTLHDVL